MIKVPKIPTKNLLIHEMFIGLNYLNYLRFEIPNFIYVYGGFMCSAPVIDQDNKVVSWCTNNGNEELIPYFI